MVHQQYWMPTTKGRIYIQTQAYANTRHGGKILVQHAQRISFNPSHVESRKIQKNEVNAIPADDLVTLRHQVISRVGINSVK